VNAHTPARRTYLDHASTSPLRSGVLDAMLPYLAGHYADPGRMHTEARMTRVAIESAREQVAAFVGARPREVVFTSGGTEAINHAHHWVRGHVVTTAVEHSAVRDSISNATTDVTIVDVDRRGRVDPDAITRAIRPDTVLVSVQLANHEVGTVQSLDFVRRTGVLLHVDACAAVGNIPVSFRTLGADLMSVTAHKLGGPKGVGALVVRRGVRIPSLILGGAQERARRAGLENVPAIVGFGAAVSGLDVEAEAEANRGLIARAIAGIARIDNIDQLGSGELPNILSLSVGGVEAEPVLLGLDQAGVAVHSGSACSSETLEPSPVLAAMGVEAEHSVRVSTGWTTTEADIDRFVVAFADVVTRLRSLRT
jgi:cysteine desulfurase